MLLWYLTIKWNKVCFNGFSDKILLRGNNQHDNIKIFWFLASNRK